MVSTIAAEETKKECSDASARPLCRFKRMCAISERGRKEEGGKEGGACVRDLRSPRSISRSFLSLLVLLSSDLSIGRVSAVFCGFDVDIGNRRICPLGVECVLTVTESKCE